MEVANSIEYQLNDPHTADTDNQDVLQNSVTPRQAGMERWSGFPGHLSATVKWIDCDSRVIHRAGTRSVG